LEQMIDLKLEVSGEGSTSFNKIQKQGKVERRISHPNLYGNNVRGGMI